MITRRAFGIGSLLGAGAFAAGFALSRWRGDESPTPRVAASDSTGSVAAGDPSIQSPSAEPAAEPSNRAVDFQFTDQHGEKRRFSDWDGTVRVVNFWATWCPPCVHEIPMLVSLQESFREQGVQFIGVAVDDPDGAFSMAKELGMNYPTMADARRTLDLLHTYGNRAAALPFTAFVDRQGTIRDRHTGELTRELTREKIRSLLP